MMPKSGTRFSEKIMLQQRGFGGIMRPAVRPKHPYVTASRRGALALANGEEAEFEERSGSEQTSDGQL
jgi:hypothetical protein